MAVRDEPPCRFPFKDEICQVHHGARSDRCLVVHGMAIVEQRADAAASIERERARLEGIVLDQQEVNSKLERAVVRMQESEKKKGATNKRLNDQLQEVLRALEIAKSRAVALGDALIERGGTDLNREQFLRLVDVTIERARKAGKEDAKDKAEV